MAVQPDASIKAKLVSAMTDVIAANQNLERQQKQLKEIDDKLSQLTDQLASWMIDNQHNKIHSGGLSYSLAKRPKSKKRRITLNHVRAVVLRSHDEATCTAIENEIKRIHVEKNSNLVVRSVMSKQSDNAST